MTDKKRRDPFNTLEENKNYYSPEDFGLEYFQTELFEKSKTGAEEEIYVIAVLDGRNEGLEAEFEERYDGTYFGDGFYELESVPSTEVLSIAALDETVSLSKDIELDEDSKTPAEV